MGNELTCGEIRELFEMVSESYQSTRIDEYGTNTPISKVMRYEALLDNLVYAIEYPDIVRSRICAAKIQKEALKKVMTQMGRMKQ